MSFGLNLKGNRVAIQVEKKEEKTESGIIIPDSAKELPNKASVVAIGPGIFSPSYGKHVPMDVEVGDKVLFTKYAGTEITVDDAKYLIIKDTDIIASFKKA
tara:strand:- start:298 stop:600 length:303 start_codon:yes stop_codon:yes gene_type:complete